MHIKDLIKFFDVQDSLDTTTPSSFNTLLERNNPDYSLKPTNPKPTRGLQDIALRSNNESDSPYLDKGVIDDNEGTKYEEDKQLVRYPLRNEQNTHQHQYHDPVPATTVFASTSAPLYLPDLDSYLSSLPSPNFPPFQTGVKVANKAVGVGMFPPMDQLAATKKSLQDLEHNSAVRPAWRNRNNIFGALTNLFLGITGSSAVATFYSLHGILDTVQIFALLLSTIIPYSRMTSVKGDWRQLFLGIIPNILALNFGTTVVQSLAFLGIFNFIAALMLLYFWSATNKFVPLEKQEGLVHRPVVKGNWGMIIVSFILSALYLPLSTIATHGLVWADDFWVVSNPYLNATVNPPVLPPLGPPDEFNDPLDFCYTTTMRRDEVNFAPIVVIVSALTFAFMTLWFPLRLRNVIAQALPRVDRYTELGKLRNRSDMDREYQRLLDRDRQPLTFLYRDFRRGWGTYKSFYLFAKLAALVIIAVISPDNCLFRSLSRVKVTIARQAVLVSTMLGFFLLQCLLAPFNDPVNNASEWTSRLNYLLTSIVGLVVAINGSFQSILDGPVLYIIYVITYGLSIYFTVINFSWMHRLVKRITGRIDFSIDVFSPRLNISPSSPHLKRRIWQETISTLFLTAQDCRIPSDQSMDFAQARDTEYPPYLLGFEGSPAERHVENLKILREVGSKQYASSLRLTADGECGVFHQLIEEIQRFYVGPDCYWDDPEYSEANGSMSRFGTAWWLPFPPTLVLRYDDGPFVTLNEMHHFQLYVIQNRSQSIRRKRQIRTALRALDGQLVYWPYTQQKTVGRHTTFCCFGRNYQAQTIQKFRTCTLDIRKDGRLPWKGFDFGSGFNILFTYSKDVRADKDVLDIDDNWNLSPSMARFLSINHELIKERLPILEQAILDYREYHWKECKFKADVLSYAFLIKVYDQPQEHKSLVQYLSEEKDIRVRQLAVGSEAVFVSAFERYKTVISSDAAAWWYIFWDDLWRRNYDTVKQIRTHEKDFDPHYPTSVAYRPMARPILESFLRQRGLYPRKPRSNDFFHPGFLNKLYFRLNGIVFRNSAHSIPFHVGEGSSEFVLSEVDELSHARSSSLGTGGGTDHDDSSIRARPTYRWEGILEDPLLRNSSRRSKQGWMAKLGVWFGITPLWRTGVVSRGLALDVVLQDGKYIPLLNRK